jgi:uncharacterized protein
MWYGRRVVDADSHVMEPAWLWERYLDPEFRADGIRVRRDEKDGDKLIIRGAPSRFVRRLGGIAPDESQTARDWNSLALNSYAPYEDSCTSASWQPKARLTLLDDTGIDTAFLFPSLGLIWPREVDPRSPYAAAHFDAYNRWLLDFAAQAPERLVPVGQLALTEGRGVTRTAERLAAAGIRHVMLPFGSDTVADLTEFFAAAQDLGLVVHLHKVAIPHLLPLDEPTTLRSARAGRLYNHVVEIMPGQLFLTALLDAGVPDRFPGLRFVFHECNAGWIPAWLERVQESYETLAAAGPPPLAEEPAHYLRERDTFFFSTGLGEDLADRPDWLLRRILLATDYPHPGYPADPQDAWSDTLSALPPERGDDLLSGNADRASHEGVMR